MWFQAVCCVFTVSCTPAKVENGFILHIEKEIFIDQLKDIVDKAEDMLNEDGEEIGRASGRERG